VVGRDITSEVLPHAEIKIFLTASLESRAQRKYHECKGKVSLEELKRELSERDERDKNRSLSPLKKTADSYEIDTTDLSLAEVIEKINSLLDPPLPITFSAELLEKELEIFVGKLERIRSNQISLETIRGLTIIYQGERKPLKTISSLRISPSNELVIRAFEPQLTSLITEPVRKMGYKLEGITKNEAYFTLLSSGESREKLTRDVKSITEEGKVAFRQVRQAFREKIGVLAQGKSDKRGELRISADQKRKYEIEMEKLVKDYQEKLIRAEEKKIRELGKI
ncbi:1964_t:CDS:2, partial [Racocetra fulgida]